MRNKRLIGGRSVALCALILVIGGCNSGQARAEPDPEPEPDPEVEAPEVDEPETAAPAPDPDIDVPEGFVLIPAGTGKMGIPREIDPGFSSNPPIWPEHEVTITRDLLVMDHKVNVGDWIEVMPPEYMISNSHGAERLPLTTPVETSWEYALIFCDELSRIEGFKPCYDFANRCPDPLRDLPGCLIPMSEALDCEGYRLPTEAEWDRAMRAGRSSAQVLEIRYVQPDGYWNEDGTVYIRPELPLDWDKNPVGISGMFSGPAEFVWDQRNDAYDPALDIDPVYAAPYSEWKSTRTGVQARYGRHLTESFRVVRQAASL